MLTKNFSTQTVETSSCWFRRDYSYRTNPKTCLRCQFCYCNTNPAYPERRRSSTYIDKNEKFHSKTIFKTPVIISRFCEPFTDGASTNASIDVAAKCLENNCQFIFKTALDLPSRAVNLVCTDKKNTQVQLRFISDDSSIGDRTTKELSTGFSTAFRQLHDGELFIKLGMDVCAIFDPFIIGVNNIHCKNLVKQLADHGLKKLIIKQLFATDYFLQYLKLRVDRKHTRILNVNTSGYWTYDNRAYLEYLYPILEECVKYGISISVCSNRVINEIIYGDKNCCQFSNPIGFYDKEGKIING